jgi:hypothetical protein
MINSVAANLEHLQGETSIRRIRDATRDLEQDMRLAFPERSAPG